MAVDRITELVQEGLRRKLCGDLPGAAEAWNQALALNPNNARARSYLDALIASGALPSADAVATSAPATPVSPFGSGGFASPPLQGKPSPVPLPSPFGPAGVVIPASEKKAQRATPESPLGSGGFAVPSLAPALPLPGPAESSPEKLPWADAEKPVAKRPPAAVSAAPATPPRAADDANRLPWGGQDAGPDPSPGATTRVFGAPASRAQETPVAMSDGRAAAEGGGSTLVFGAAMAPPATQPKLAGRAPAVPQAAHSAASPFAPSVPSSPFSPTKPASPFSPSAPLSPLQPASPLAPVAAQSKEAGAVTATAEEGGIGRLLQMAADLLDLDDHSGALEAAEKALAIEPGNPTAQEIASTCQRTLQTMYESKLGDLSATPKVLMRPDEIVWLTLDHRAGFLLSMIDGQVSYEDLFALSSMSRLDTARILSKLLQDRVIG